MSVNEEANEEKPSENIEANVQENIRNCSHILYYKDCQNCCEASKNEGLIEHHAATKGN